MKNVSFGISQIRAKTPEFIHWISITGASVVTAMAALQLIYPQFITEHLIAETGKAVAAIRIIGQLFGVKPEEPAQNN